MTSNLTPWHVQPDDVIKLQREIELSLKHRRRKLLPSMRELQAYRFRRRKRIADDDL